MGRTILNLFIWLSSGLVLRYIYLQLNKKIQEESDGGGWDPGTTFVWYPELPIERSRYNRITDYNNRILVLFWILAALFPFIPLMTMIVVGFFQPVFWFFSGRGYNSWEE